MFRALRKHPAAFTEAVSPIRRAYTSEELEELLKLRTKKQGTPLGWGIIRKLMAVPDKDKRREIELSSSFADSGGGSRAARRVKFPPANRS